MKIMYQWNTGTLLGLLLIALCGCFLLLFGQDFVFHHKLDSLEQQIDNERHLVRLGAFIHSREQDFHRCMDEMPTCDGERCLHLLYQAIDNDKKNIFHALEVIKEGGRVVVTHKNNPAEAAVVEYLDYRPQRPFMAKTELDQLQQLIMEMDKQVKSLRVPAERGQTKGKQQVPALSSQDDLHGFFQQLQPLLNGMERTGENIYSNAVFRLQQLEKKKRRQQKIYIRWSLASGFFLAAATLLLALFTAFRIRTIQQENEQQRQRFRTVADQSYAWEYWLDPSGRLEYISPSCERISGYSPDTFLQDPDLLTTIIVPEDREMFLRHLREGEDECPFFTFRITTAAGEERWIQHTCRKVVDGQGRYMGRRGSNIDCTDQHRAEQRIITSRQEWIDTFDAIPDSVMLLDRQFRIHKINRKTAELLGCSIQELLGRVCYHEFHCTLHPTENCPLIDLLGDGCTHTEEVYVERLGKYFDITVSPLTDGNGRVTGAVHVARDITRQRRAECARRELMASLEDRVAQRTTQLQQAYSDLEQIFEVALPLVVVGNDFVVDRVNRAFCKFFNIRKEQVVGNHCYDLWEGEFCHGRECSLELLRSGAQSVTRYVDGKALQGQMITCSIQSVPYHDAAGKFIGQISSFFDLSDRKRVEQRLEKVRKQLLHVEKMNAIGSLSASIAHEFNNPLCGVLSVLERLQREASLTKIDQEMVTIALREGERMKRLIMDLQNFNRPTSGRVSRFDLHKALESMVVFIQKEMSRHGIRLSRKYCSESVVVEAVEDQIKQVILNLLKNAVEAIGDDGGEITIETALLDTEAELRIKDTGSGINKADLSRIFEPFFTTKSPQKGTGLGLAVSYGIIKAHGGTIDVESRPGQRTVFILRLPLNSTLNKGTPA